MGLRAGLDGCGTSCPTPGFDPQTVQPIASRYTDPAIPLLINVNVLFVASFVYLVVHCHHQSDKKSDGRVNPY